MAKGWTVSFVGEAGELRIFHVGIYQKQAAIAAVTRDASSAVAVELSDEDYRRLALVPGQVLESKDQS